jgi:hypothetical protein
VTVDEDGVAVEGMGQHGRVLHDLARQPILGLRQPLLVGRGGELGDRRQRDSAGSGEALEQRAEADVVVEVGVGDVDRRQPLTGGLDGLGEALDVCRCVQRVDEDRFGRAGDDRRGCGRERATDRDLDGRSNDDLQLERFGGIRHGCGSLRVGRCGPGSDDGGRRAGRDRPRTLSKCRVVSLASPPGIRSLIGQDRDQRELRGVRAVDEVRNRPYPRSLPSCKRLPSWQ